MVRSNSLTERLKLWDRYTGMVDQDAIKLKFLSKVHRKDPPFRIKMRMPRRKMVPVSSSITFVEHVHTLFLHKNRKIYFW